MTDTYYLSPRNPCATTDQQWLDATAIELFGRPDVQQAKERAAGAFARVTDKVVSPEVWSMFRAYVDSFAFRSIQLAVNSDANHPRIYRVYSPAAEWLGNRVPESRWGQENPDNIYRIIPVEYGGRYVLRGRRDANPPADVSYTLVADTNTSITLGLLGQGDLIASNDGSFEITLDETPAAGRGNHVQVTPEARYLFIRDTLSDWRQVPNTLRIERINPPARAELSIDERAAKVAMVMRDGVMPAYYWARIILNAKAGEMSQVQGTGPSGGLLTQVTSHGWFQLKDGEAAVIRFDPLDAAYCSIVLYDIWGRSREYRDHLTSLNTSQMVADQDGRFTIVIAAADPGVHNWLDTDGLREVAVGLRWQAISPKAATPPRIESRVVASNQLPCALSGVARAPAASRARQVAERQAGYDLRLMEA